MCPNSHFQSFHCLLSIIFSLCCKRSFFSFFSQKGCKLGVWASSQAACAWECEVKEPEPWLDWILEGAVQRFCLGLQDEFVAHSKSKVLQRPSPEKAKYKILTRGQQEVFHKSRFSNKRNMKCLLAGIKCFHRDVSASPKMHSAQNSQ